MLLRCLTDPGYRSLLVANRGRKYCHSRGCIGAEYNPTGNLFAMFAMCVALLIFYFHATHNILYSITAYFLTSNAVFSLSIDFGLALRDEASTCKSLSRFDGFPYAHAYDLYKAPNELMLKLQHVWC